MILNSILNNKTNDLRQNLDNLWINILEKYNNHQKHISKLDLVPLYTSIDLRHSSFKTAPIDTNIFPAGFHNLALTCQEHATRVIGHYLTNAMQTAKISDHNILLVVENFDRNLQYLANIIALEKILEGTGAKIKKIKLLDAELDCLMADDYYADIIVLNADLTSGFPKKLTDLTESWQQQYGITTNIIPSISYGWYQRSKFNHFRLYNKLAASIAKEIGFDPWLCSTHIGFYDNIDFRSLQGGDKLAQMVDDLITKTQQKYTEYGIKQQPYAIVKADHGTFGMGVIKVDSGDDVLHFNKKIRHKMAKVRDGVENHKVMIQEGISSSLTTSGLSHSQTIETRAAERVLYLAAGEIIGTMLRSVPNKNSSDILNAAGMVMEAEECYAPDATELLIAELASMAAVLELDFFA